MLRLILGFHLILAVLLLLRRLFGGRLAPRLRYLLWLAVPLYLLLAPLVSIPVSVRAEALWPPAATAAERADADPALVPSASGTPDRDGQRAPSAPAAAAGERRDPVSPAAERAPAPSAAAAEREPASLPAAAAERAAPAPRPFPWRLVLWLFWGTGSAALLLLVLTRNLALLRSLRRERVFCEREPETGMRIWLLPRGCTPFLMGRQIYLPAELEKGQREYRHAVLHEVCHWRQGDSMWLWVEYLILILFWWSPLCWIARRVMRQDREMSCDEAVIRILGEQERKRYALNLLKMVEVKRDPLSITTAMNGSKSGVKARILTVAASRKHSLTAAAAAALILALVVGCGMTKAVEAGEETASKTEWTETRLEERDPGNTSGSAPSGSGEETPTEQGEAPCPAARDREFLRIPKQVPAASDDPERVPYPRMWLSDPLGTQIYIEIDERLIDRIRAVPKETAPLPQESVPPCGPVLTVCDDEKRNYLCDLMKTREGYLLLIRGSDGYAYYPAPEDLKTELLGIAEYVTGWDLTLDISQVKDLAEIQIRRGERLLFSTEDPEVCRRVEEYLLHGMRISSPGMIIRAGELLQVQSYFTNADGTVTACAVDVQESVLWVCPFAVYSLVGREPGDYPLLDLLGLPGGTMEEWQSLLQTGLTPFRDLYLRWRGACALGEARYEWTDAGNRVYYSRLLEEMGDYPDLARASEQQDFDYPRILVRDPETRELWYVSIPGELFIQILRLKNSGNEMPGEAPGTLLTFVLPDLDGDDCRVVRTAGGELALVLSGRLYEAPELAESLMTRAQTVTGWSTGESFGQQEDMRREQSIIAGIMGRNCDLAWALERADGTQRAALDAMWSVSWLPSDGVYVKQIKTIMGYLDEDVRMLTLDDVIVAVRAAASKYGTDTSAFERELLWSLAAVTDCPDYVGRGETPWAVYFLDEAHTEYITVALGQYSYHSPSGQNGDLVTMAEESGQYSGPIPRLLTWQEAQTLGLNAEEVDHISLYEPLSERSYWLLIDEEFSSRIRKTVDEAPIRVESADAFQIRMGARENELFSPCRVLDMVLDGTPYALYRDAEDTLWLVKGQGITFWLCDDQTLIREILDLVEQQTGWKLFAGRSALAGITGVKLVYQGREYVFTDPGICLELEALFKEMRPNSGHHYLTEYSVQMFVTAADGTEHLLYLDPIDGNIYVPWMGDYQFPRIMGVEYSDLMTHGFLRALGLEKWPWEQEPPTSAGPAEPEESTLTVSTVDEFLAAIGPDRTIVLAGERFDLSSASDFSGGEGEYYRWVSGGPDGSALCIHDVSGLAICGQAQILAVPRYAVVLLFENCSDITLTGLTLGHTEEPGSVPSVENGALFFSDCRNILVEDCRLGAYSTVGLILNNCEDVQAAGVEFSGHTVAAVMADGSKDLVFSDCRVAAAQTPALVFRTCSDFTWNGETYPGGDSRYTVGASGIPVKAD